MPEDRLSQLRKGYAEDDYLGLEPPDLGPLRALAETAEFAEARPGWPMPMAVRFPPMIRWRRSPATSPGR